MAGERLRLFIALALPAPVVEEVVAWQRTALRGRDSLRPIRAEALHVTLAFLGERRPAEVERAREVLESAGIGAGAVSMRLEADPVGLPPRRPRVVALEAPGEAVMELRAGLVAGLVEAGLLEPERRPFRPHLSVARVRGDPRAARRGGSRLDGLPPLPGRAGHTFDAVRVALYRSELRSQGARYSSLADVDLPHSGG